MTCQPILTILYENIQDLEEGTFRKMPLGTLYHLLLYLEEEISMIQNDLGIVGYTNSEISGSEADKNARAYHIFKSLDSPLRDVSSVVIQKFIDRK